MAIELSQLVVPVKMGELIGINAVIGGINMAEEAIVGSVQASKEWADSIDELSTKTGLANNEAAALAVIAKETGINSSDAAKAIGFMNKGLVDTNGKAGTTGKALEELGINLKGANGEMKSTSELTQEAATKIMQIKDPAERARVEMALFGKTGTDLDDTLSALANGGLTEAEAKARAFGLSVGANGVSAAEDMQKAMADLQMTFQGFQVILGSALMPALNKLLPVLTNTLNRPEIQAAIKKLADALVQVVDAVIPLIPALLPLVTGVLPSLITMFAGVITSVLPLVEQILPVLIELFMNVISAIAPAISIILPPLVELFNAVVVQIMPLVATLLPQLVILFARIIAAILPVITAILPPLITLILTLIPTILPLIVQILPQLSELFIMVVNAVMPLVVAILPVLVNLVMMVISAFMPMLSKILPLLIDLFMNVINAIMPLVLAVLPTLIPLILTLIEAFMPLLEAILPPLTELFTGIIGVLMEIISAVLPPLTDLIKGLTEKFNEWLPVVKNVASFLSDKLQGAFEGISNAIKKVVDWVRDLIQKFKDVKDALPDFLVPGSPTPLELGLRGINDAMKDINRTGLPSLQAGISVSGTPSSKNQQSQAGIDYSEMANTLAPVFARALRVELQKV